MGVIFQKNVVAKQSLTHSQLKIKNR